ncbi:hypothetical protein FRX31_007908 [Thalictrum thalictroides]|uniref:Uncharacterized protein n=1 Tax=Thalictrum thalictroides TaxID=46969 RepID=A0A7J6X102_THATH|nr:hypothetical protein FRX31_007908 [Thalictrum thalictroides]
MNPWDVIQFSSLPDQYYHNNRLSNVGDHFVDGVVIVAARTLPTWVNLTKVALMEGGAFERQFLQTDIANQITGATYEWRPEFIRLFVKSLGATISRSDKKILFLSGGYSKLYQIWRMRIFMEYICRFNDAFDHS